MFSILFSLPPESPIMGRILAYGLLAVWVWLSVRLIRRIREERRYNRLIREKDKEIARLMLELQEELRKHYGQRR